MQAAPEILGMFRFFLRFSGLFLADSLGRGEVQKYDTLFGNPSIVDCFVVYL